MSNPALLIWNRLEPQPRGEDIEKALRAEIRDPLWMLSRQWQLGEFQAENAGIVSFVRLTYQKYNPHKIRWNDDTTTAFSGEDQPLEVMVENSEYTPDLFTRIEIGRHWTRLLNKYLPEEGKTEKMEAFKRSQRLHFQQLLQNTDDQKIEQSDLLSDEPYLNIILALSNESIIDGGILIDIIADEQYVLSEYILGYKDESIDTIGQQLLVWANRIYNLKIGESKGWHTSHLEHQFELDIPSGEGGIKKLKAEEFFGDALDWHQFDFSKNETEYEAPSDPTIDEIEEREEVLMPSPIRYTGMPSTRWWEMEDSTVNFGNIKANTTNPTALIFSQFALIYGNDWLMMPLPLEIGALYKINNMVITDNFGFQTQVRHIHETAPDEKWGFFQLHNEELGLDNQNDTCLFLPPTLDKVQKSKPLEQVSFIRDEMANMVWAIEEIIPDHFGTGTSGSDRATVLSEFLSGIETDQPSDGISSQVMPKYQIGTSVPEHWIPFIPLHIKDGNLTSRRIQLRRASMPRIINGMEPVRIRPKTPLLKKGLAATPKQAYDIFEEEVPRSGAIVSGSWKRARWINGKTFVWYARQKTNGRGEGASQLKFDQLLDK